MNSLFPANLKTIVPDFKQEFKYTDENEKELIASIAERIACIYADFLTIKDHTNRSIYLNSILSILFSVE